jgi:hypothetical protein
VGDQVPGVNVLVQEFGSLGAAKTVEEAIRLDHETSGTARLGVLALGPLCV